MGASNQAPLVVVSSDHSVIIRRTALATAIGLAIGPAFAQAEGWSRNIELFALPTTERTLMGGQWLEPVWQDQTSMVYLDFRGVFQVGRTDEFNFGAGYRKMAFDRRWIFGGYAAFDTRSTEADNRFNQVTMGIEALSREWDFRANGYIPVTSEKTLGPASFGGRFEGNRLFTGRRTEEALHGADLEVGRLLNFIPFGETRLYIGGYHFDGDVVSKSTGLGKRARLEFRPRKDIALEFGAQDDNLFGTEGFIKIRYSFGMPAETGVRTMDERMVQFAERDIDIKTTGGLPENITTATGPGNDLLVTSNVIHVDNENDDPAGGEGTFENPYNTVADCNNARCAGNPGALIYVHEGIAPYAEAEGSFSLENRQRLLGQGVSLYGIGGDVFPSMQGHDIAVSLASNNEVAGLEFRNNYVGVVSYFEGSNSGSNFNIHSNRFIGNEYAGAAILNANSSSTGRIAGNYFEGNYIGVLAANGAFDGLDSTQNLAINDNRFSYNGYGVKAYNVAEGGGTATQNLTLNGNVFENNYEAGAFFENSETVTTNGQLDPPKYRTARQNVDLNNNTFSNNEFGIYFLNRAAGSGATAIQNATLANNTIRGNKYGIGAYNVAEGGEEDMGNKYPAEATQSLVLTDNVISDNAYGVKAYNISGTDAGDKYPAAATQSLVLTDNVISNNEIGVGSINAAKYGGFSSQSTTSSGNQITNNAAFGSKYMNMADEGVALQEVNLTNHNASNNGVANVTFLNLSSDGYAGQQVNASGGNFSGANTAGALIFNYAEGGGGALQEVDLTNANLSNNNGYGALISNKYYDGGNASQFVDLTGANVSGNYYGVFIADDDPEQTIIGP